MSKFSVAGKSVKDIAKMSQNQLNKLTDRELRQATSRLVSASNKRIRRLQEADMQTKALESIGGQQFSIKGKSREDVLAEFAKASHFLELKTSTVTEARKAIKEVERVTGEELTSEEITLLNQAYGTLKDKAQAIVNANYNQIRSEIAESIVQSRGGNVPKDAIIQNAQDILTEVYEDDEPDSFSDFFDFGGN